jgi:hypothetical protein
VEHSDHRLKLQIFVPQKGRLWNPLGRLYAAQPGGLMGLEDYLETKTLHGIS